MFSALPDEEGGHVVVPEAGAGAEGHDAVYAADRHILRRSGPRLQRVHEKAHIRMLRGSAVPDGFWGGLARQCPMPLKVFFTSGIARRYCNPTLGPEHDLAVDSGTSIRFRCGCLRKAMRCPAGDPLMTPRHDACV